jgi:hypothetical protein
VKWLVVLLVACGGAAVPEPPVAPRVKAPSCAAAADGMVGVLLADKDPKPPDDTVDGIRNLIRDRCQQDGWSAEAQRCLAEMKTPDDANTCGTLLTEAQQGALVQAQSARQK